MASFNSAKSGSKLLTYLLVHTFSASVCFQLASAQPISKPTQEPVSPSESNTAPNHPVSDHALHVPPGYYSQTNQSLGALLTIYDAPSDNAAVVVQLPGDTILNSDGAQKQNNETLWQKVSLGEIEGWVRAQQIVRARPISFAGTDLPVLGVCGGTEPSWSIEWNSKTVTYAKITGLLNRLPVKSVVTEKDKATSQLTAQDDKVTIQMAITEKECSYTPLDSFVWGEAVATITETGQPPVTLMGCCRPVSDGYRTSTPPAQ